MRAHDRGRCLVRAELSTSPADWRQRLSEHWRICPPIRRRRHSQWPDVRVRAGPIPRAALGAGARPVLRVFFDGTQTLGQCSFRSGADDQRAAQWGFAGRCGMRALREHRLPCMTVCCLHPAAYHHRHGFLAVSVEPVQECIPPARRGSWFRQTQRRSSRRAARPLGDVQGFSSVLT